MSDSKIAFPKSPKGLNEPGKKAWLIGKPLWDDGTLVSGDLRAWETYCKAVDEVAHCEAILKQHGEYQLTPQGYYVQHPAVNRKRDAEKTMWRYEQAFGLVPDKRTKRPATSNAKGVATRKR